jgi:hypothetical protein
MERNLHWPIIAASEIDAVQGGAPLRSLNEASVFDRFSINAPPHQHTAASRASPRNLQ